jgi:hypothetical protein
VSKHQEQIIAAANGKLDEEILGAASAKPRVVPLGAVDSLQVKRMGLTGVMEISSGGASFKLEGKPGDMKELADVFERAKAAAPA